MENVISNSLILVVCVFAFVVSGYGGSGIVAQYKWANQTNCDSEDFAPIRGYQFGVCVSDGKYNKIASFDSNIITIAHYSDKKCTKFEHNLTAPLFQCVCHKEKNACSMIVPGPALVIFTHYKSADCTGSPIDKATRYLSYACWNSPKGGSERLDMMGANVVHTSFTGVECNGEAKAEEHILNECYKTDSGSAQFKIDY